MAGIIILASNVHYRESYESAIQISMLTNELRDLPAPYAEKMISTISDRSSSYYGYVLVPDKISDRKVYDLMKYRNVNDKQYATLLKNFELDFAWFDIQGRHIMVWGKSIEKVENAINTIKTWLCLIMCNYY